MVILRVFSFSLKSLGEILFFYNHETGKFDENVGRWVSEEAYGIGFTSALFFLTMLLIM